MKKLTFLFLLAGFLACGQQQSTPEPKNLDEQVTAFIQADQYEDALALLEQQEETEEVLRLREKTHLNYGQFLVYRSEQEMRLRMNEGMRQYIAVLKLNPENEKAVSEIQQILGVYSTFPNREPEPDVVEDLRELGFEI